MALKKSLYDPALHRLDNIKNKGYDYQGQVLKNSTSNFIWRDETRASMLGSLEPVITELIENVKMIKNMYHFAVTKFYKNRN